MGNSVFKSFMEASRPISTFRVGTRVIDISGRVVTINRHEANITWVYQENAQLDCYANCAHVIAFDQPTADVDQVTCDACNQPITADQKNVGHECDLHEHCAEV